MIKRDTQVNCNFVKYSFFEEFDRFDTTWPIFWQVQSCIAYDRNAIFKGDFIIFQGSIGSNYNWSKRCQSGRVEVISCTLLVIFRNSYPTSNNLLNNCLIPFLWIYSMISNSWSDFVIVADSCTTLYWWDLSVSMELR